MLVASSYLECRFCGQPHVPVAAARGTRLLCTRCGITLARRSLLGPQAPLAFTFTALLLAIPALLLPFATVEKIGAPRSTRVIDGAVALWDHGLPVLGTTVALCGLLVPLALGITLLAGLAVRRHAARTLAAQRIVHALDAWAMPEVHVLAVLVSFVRIEALADVEVGPGFWCYTAMAVALVLASRGFRLEPLPQ